MEFRLQVILLKKYSLKKLGSLDSLLFLGPEIYGLHEILEEPVKILSFFVSLAKDYCSSIFLPQPGLVIIFQRQFIQEIYIPDRLTPFSS